MDFGSFCYMYKQKFSHATLVIAKYCSISFNSNQLWRVTQKLELRYSYIGRADRDTRKNSFIPHVPLGQKTSPAWGNRWWIWSWEEEFKVCWNDLVQTQLFWRFLKQNMHGGEIEFLGHFSPTLWLVSHVRRSPRWPVTCTKTFVYFACRDAWHTNWLKCYSTFPPNMNRIMACLWHRPFPK